MAQLLSVYLTSIDSPEVRTKSVGGTFVLSEEVTRVMMADLQLSEAFVI